MTTKSVNVVAVSLATKNKPAMLMGSLTDNALHVITLSTLPASVSGIREQLSKMQADLEAKGTRVSWFVEDPTGLLSGTGYGIRLDDKTHDGRPVLALAMERYKALTAVAGITYPQSGGSPFQITDSILNMKMGDNGRAVYEIDWPQLKDGSRVLMLLIYGAMCQGPMQIDYLERLYDEAGRAQSVSYERTSFMAATVGIDADRFDKTPPVAGWREGIL